MLHPMRQFGPGSFTVLTSSLANLDLYLLSQRRVQCLDISDHLSMLHLILGTVFLVQTASIVFSNF